MYDQIKVNIPLASASAGQLKLHTTIMYVLNIDYPKLLHNSWFRSTAHHYVKLLKLAWHYRDALIQLPTSDTDTWA